MGKIQYLRRIFIFILAGVAMFQLAGLAAQDNQSLIAQKVLLENTIRERISDALQTILDDIKFVVDVKIEMQFEPMQRRETVYRQGKAKQPVTGVQKDTPAPVSEVPEKSKQEAEKPAESPLPGYELLPGIPMYSSEKEKKPAPAEKITEKPEQADRVVTKEVQETQTEPEIYSHSVEQSTLSIPKISRMSINVILEDGIDPDILENVRNVVEVAAQYDRTRGDVLSIMTSAFRKKEKGDDIDAIFLKNIAEKIEQIERRQREAAVQKQIEQKRDFAMESVRRDSQRIAMLTDELSRLKMQLMASDLDQEERSEKEQQAVQREQELQMVRSQLDESNKRLAELERGVIEEGRRQLDRTDNTLIYFLSGIIVVALLILILILIFSQRAKVHRQERDLDSKYRQPPTMAPAPAAPVEKPSGEGEEKTAPPTVKHKVKKPTSASPENQQEMKGLRQSVISLTVGKPNTAGDILKSWLNEPTSSEEGSEEEVAE